MQVNVSPVSKALLGEFRRNLRVLEREIVRQLQTETACCGVTLAQCHVLLELSRAGTLSLTDLAGLMQLDRSTLSRTVEGLVKTGLVFRAADPDDRRAIRLTCAPEGSARVAAIDDGCNRQYAAMLRRVSADRRQHIIDTVRFLAGAIPEIRNAGPDTGSGCCAPGKPGDRRAGRRSPGPRTPSHVSRRSRQ